MQINDVVLGLAAGVGIDLSPDGKTAYYVEWSVGEVSKVDVKTGMVSSVLGGLAYPQDVEVDWAVKQVFVSERTGAVVRIWPGERAEVITKPGGAPHQLALVKAGGKRYLYTVCYDSGQLLRIDIDAKTQTIIATGLGHPIGIVIDAAEKYAYVTEQDTGALAQIELASGTAKRLYTGLIAPFYLAWDKDRVGLFCVQRDPANSLVRLKLGAAVTVSTIANGLAWRPSGVAPNADDTFIYICADQELEVICPSGTPPIKRAKPPFEIHSIQFNYEKSSAIGMKDHVTGSMVPVPEYVTGVRSEPAAYVAGALPRIKVVLKKRPGYVAGSYMIGAIGTLGGVRRKKLTPVFLPSGLSKPIEFELMWPLPSAVSRLKLILHWYARKSTGASVPVSVGPTGHRIFVVLAKPTEPWVTETPWVAGMELVCGWGAGTTNVDDAAARITERYYNCGRLSYDIVSGATFYGFTNYKLSEMIERLNGGIGLGEKVNCTDSANTVSTLANLLGCDLWQSRMGWYFDLNPILAIGYPPPNPMPTWSGFSYHEVAWKGACTENDRLFDGCLCVDGDADPTRTPQAWLLPKNMRFGDCTTMEYRLRLCPPVPGGCPTCSPQPTTRQRRPIS